MHSGGKYNHQRSQETHVECAEEEGEPKSRPDTMSNLYDVIGNEHAYREAVWNR